jgi:S-disulfanyl-L-cysteine oxidoreductase SoxD
MKSVRTFIAAMVGLWTVAVMGAAGHSQTPPVQEPNASAQSVWDGVYTEEQAKRGNGVYTAECERCHGSSLEGADMAPPLAGGNFVGNWNGQKLSELFERIRVTMPDGNPGKLTRQQTADVVAYILSSGKIPAGQTELPTDLTKLTQIKFEAAKK